MKHIADKLRKLATSGGKFKVPTETMAKVLEGKKLVGTSLAIVALSSRVSEVRGTQGIEIALAVFDADGELLGGVAREYLFVNDSLTFARLEEAFKLNVTS